METEAPASSFPGRESQCAHLVPTTANPSSLADLSRCSHTSSLAPNLELRGKMLSLSWVHSRRTSLGEGCKGYQNFLGT